MIALSTSLTLAIAGVIVVLSSASAVGAGNFPPLPGPYQSMTFGIQGGGYVQPQTTRQPQNTHARVPNAPAPVTFPTPNFPVPYWMQAGPQNGNQVTNQQVAPNSNFGSNQAPQQNPNNGGWGYSPNNRGYVEQYSSEFFPGYGAGFGAGFFGTNSNGNAPQGYQNNNTLAPANPTQGNFAPRSNWGVQWNGFGNNFGNGQGANPWGGYGYPSQNGSNNRWPYGPPNMMQW